MTDAGRASPPAADAGGVTPEDQSDAGPTASAVGLWAETLQSLASYVAHDLRNALNGVAVNLEVVRGRSARGAEASAIAPFAANAAAQFEGASAGTEALLAFARPESGDPDVGAIAVRVAQLVGLRNPSLLRVTDAVPGKARTSVPADVARSVVARSVLAALGQGDAVACEITVGRDIFLRITGTSHTLPPPDPELAAVASANGVRFALRGNVLEIRFPVSSPRVTPAAPA